MADRESAFCQDRVSPPAGLDFSPHVVHAAHDREVLGQLVVDLPADGAQRSPELLDHVRPEPLLPAALDVIAHRRPDLERLATGLGGTDDPVATERPAAAPTVTLRRRRAIVRGGPDEDVAPALHAPEHGKHLVLGQAGHDWELADADPVVADEAQEVRPHHERHAEPADEAGLGEPALELVVELDRVRDQCLRQRRRERRFGHVGGWYDDAVESSSSMCAAPSPSEPVPNRGLRRGRAQFGQGLVEYELIIALGALIVIAAVLFFARNVEVVVQGAGETTSQRTLKPPVAAKCDASYQGVCIPPAPPDLDCPDLEDMGIPASGQPRRQQRPAQARSRRRRSRLLSTSARPRSTAGPPQPLRAPQESHRRAEACCRQRL